MALPPPFKGTWRRGWRRSTPCGFELAVSGRAEDALKPWLGSEGGPEPHSCLSPGPGWVPLASTHLCCLLSRLGPVHAGALGQKALPDPRPPLLQMKACWLPRMSPGPLALGTVTHLAVGLGGWRGALPQACSTTAPRPPGTWQSRPMGALQGPGLLTPQSRACCERGRMRVSLECHRPSPITTCGVFNTAQRPHWAPDIG